MIRNVITRLRNLLSRLRARFVRTAPVLTESATPTPTGSPAFLGALERLPDGRLLIMALASTDTLFTMGCQAGDIVLSLDGVVAARIPDDVLLRATCSRAIISRDGEIIGLPDAEFLEHSDPAVLQKRNAEIMDVAMAQLARDPEHFLKRNRNAGPPPPAREGLMQPTNLVA